MKSTRLILIRHGETRWNAQFKYIGLTDLDLTKKGRMQAKALAESLRKIPLKAIYSSPLKRAYQTATIIARDHNLEVKTKAGLKEIDFGDWEGLTLEEIKKNYFSIYRRWFEGNEDFQMPAGESWISFQRRANRVFREILMENPRGTVALVSHGGTLKTIIIEALGLGSSAFWKISQSQASLSILEYKNSDVSKPVLLRLNDCCHLS